MLIIRRTSSGCLPPWEHKKKRNKQAGRRPTSGHNSVCKVSLAWRSLKEKTEGENQSWALMVLCHTCLFTFCFQTKSPITEQGLYTNIIFLGGAKLNLSKNDSLLRGAGFSDFSSCIWVFLLWYVNPSSHLICPRQYKQHLQRVLLSIRHAQTACFSHCQLKLRDSNGPIQTSLLGDNQTVAASRFGITVSPGARIWWGRDGWLFQHFLHSQQGVDLGSCWAPWRLQE